MDANAWLQTPWTVSAPRICFYPALPIVSAWLCRPPGSQTHIRSACFLCPLQILHRQAKLKQISQYTGAHKICYSSSFPVRLRILADLSTSRSNQDLLLLQEEGPMPGRMSCPAARSSGQPLPGRSPCILTYFSLMSPPLRWILIENSAFEFH